LVLSKRVTELCGLLVSNECAWMRMVCVHECAIVHEWRWWVVGDGECMSVVGECMSTQVWLMSLHECDLRSVESGHLYAAVYLQFTFQTLDLRCVHVWLWWHVKWFQSFIYWLWGMKFSLNAFHSHLAWVLWKLNTNLLGIRDTPLRVGNSGNV
jgi:hypothetical protein